MYFKECERIAHRHPNLAPAVERIDAQLWKIRTAEAIRAADWASFLGIDPNQVRTVLACLAEAEFLRAEEMMECAHCGMPVLRSDYESARDEEDEYLCTNCDRPWEDEEMQSIITYRRGRNWPEVPTPPESSPQESASSEKKLDDDGSYTYTHIAQVYGVDKDALRKRLDRFRHSNLGNSWKEQTERGPRESKYLYQPGAIKGIIEELRASSTRPAK